MSKLYFITGSQDLYGEETLAQVAENSKAMAAYLSEKLGDVCTVEWEPVVIDSDSIRKVCIKATADDDCIGVITWMHTFSPAKMWIKGLQHLKKPLLHLHTQFNERLPYDEIDMDFMNLNQAAHGDREYSFILARLGIPHEIVVGYYKNDCVISQTRRFARVAKAIAFSRDLKVAMLGNNMRHVAVTDGDRVESQIRFGWEVNYYGIDEIASRTAAVTEAEVDEVMAAYANDYTMNTDNLAAVREQAKYDIAIARFLKDEDAGAFTDTFQDLAGLDQLPGLAVQRHMAKGIGFAAEGDYKTAALSAVMWQMAHGQGCTGFMEDYTYDFADGLELGAHMLEVSPAFAAGKPAVEVHPLGIGGKNPPARLVFDGTTGDAVAVCMIDLGDRFRLICADIELVAQPKPMPKLPVARLMWKVKPDFTSGIKAWLEAGGGHHTVVSTGLTREDIALFAKLTGTELVTIG